MKARRAQRPTFLQGRLLTMAERLSAEATGVAVKKGVIERIFYSEAENDDVQPGSEILDFGRRAILPGFLDGHAHIEVGAVAAQGVDCRVPTVTSISDILDGLHGRLEDAEDRGGWLVGQANLFLDQKLTDRRLPNRHDLDKVSTDVAILVRAGGHISCVNSKALEWAGLNDFKSSSSTMGGPTVEKGPDGRPTGIIAELDRSLPIPPLKTDRLREALLTAARELFIARGVTHVGEITETLEGVQLLDELAATAKIHTRISLALWAPGTLQLDQALSWPEHLKLRSTSDRVHVRGVKIFTDGGFSARTAAMLTPYIGEHANHAAPSGELAMTPQAIEDALRRICGGQLQPIVHTCGELATRVVANAGRGLTTDAATQVRVEHAGHLFIEREKTFALMRQANLRPMPNPAFLHTIGPSLPGYVGEVARGNRFLFHDMLEHGFRISGSSDLHVGSHPSQTNPFFMIWCSVSRTGFDGSPVDPEQAIDVHRALKMHTLYAAEALGVADRQGTIEPGKIADLVVLDCDPLEVASNDLPKVNVDFVFVDGVCVYQREGAIPPERRVAE